MSWRSRPSSARPFLQGDHICSVYETREEQVETAAAFIADGLRREERCLYVPDDAENMERFREALSQQGVDVAAAVRETSLLLKTKHEAHLEGGRFDYERMLAMLNGAVEEALNDGFKGLRTCGDMSWLLDEMPGSQQVIEYEAQLSQFFTTVRALGMCQYDRSRLPDRVLNHALETHESVVVGRRHSDNPFRGDASPHLPLTGRLATLAIAR